MSPAVALIPLIMFGIPVLEALLKSNWVEHYLNFGFRVQKKTFSFKRTIDEILPYQPPEGNYTQRIEFKGFTGEYGFLKEENMFVFAIGGTKMFYTPVIHAKISIDQVAGKLTIRGILEFIPTLIWIISIIIPLFFVLYVILFEKVNYAIAFFSLAFPIFVSMFMIFVVNTQMRRYKNYLGIYKE